MTWRQERSDPWTSENTIVSRRKLKVCSFQMVKVLIDFLAVESSSDEDDEDEQESTEQAAEGSAPAEEEKVVYRSAYSDEK